MLLLFCWTQGAAGLPTNTSDADIRGCRAVKTAAPPRGFIPSGLTQPSIGDLPHVLLFLLGVLRRAEIESNLVNLTSELERTIIAILDHRDPGARVLSDAEVLVFRERDRDRVFHRLLSYRFPIHEQLARAALGEAGTIVLEVESDGVLAGF